MIHSRGALVLCCLAAVGAFAVRAEDEDPAAMVEKLNSDDFDARTNAAQALEALGEKARAALEKGALHKDPEIVSASKTLLGKLQQAFVEILAFNRDGKPAAGATGELQLYNYSGGQQPAPETFTVKEDGTVKLTSVSSGPQQGNLKWKKWSLLNGEHGSFQVEGRPGLNAIYYNMTSGGTVTGQVLDQDGKPLKDAKFGLHNSTYYDLESFIAMQGNMGNQVDERLSGTTDTEGKVKLEGVADGAYQCYAQHSDYKVGAGSFIRVHEGRVVDAAPIKLLPKNLGKIQFVFKKADGTPLKAANPVVRLTRVYDDPKEAEREKQAARTRRQNHFGMHEQPAPTDDEGKLAKDNVEAGKYNVFVRCGGDDDRMGMFGGMRAGGKTPEFVEYAAENVVVSKDQTLDLTLKPVEGGTLTGKILTADGKGIKDVRINAILESELVDLGYDPFGNNNNYYYGDQGHNARSAKTDGNGVFTFKKLLPGRYALAVTGANGQSARVYGLEVAAGKPATAPDVKFEVKQAGGAGVSMKDVKGKVTGSDGKAPPNVNLTLESGTGSFGVGAQGGGNFDFSVYGAQGDTTEATRLVVKAQGYKTATVDLTAPDVLKAPLQIQLQKRVYGTLKVTVVDQDGKPVKDAAVKPRATPASYRMYGRRNNALIERTDGAGEASFSGLGDGKRKISVELQGYYADGGLEVTIPPGGAAETKVTLRKGLVIKGQLELPAGMKPAVGVVQLRPASNPYQNAASAKVAENGAFQFDGLEPGDYTVTANAPALVCAEPVKLTLATGQKEPAAARVRMVKPGAAAVLLPPEFNGCRVSLMPPDMLSSAASQRVLYSSYSESWAGTVDGNGRAEFWGVAPGNYSVTVYPRSMYMNRNQNATPLTPVAGSVAVKELGSAAELRDLPAQKLEFSGECGTVIARLAPDFPQKRNRHIQAHMTVTLVGKNGMGTFAAYSGQPRPRAAQVIGTPPAGLKQSDPSVYTMSDVPAGEYKVFVTSAWNDPYNPTAAKQEEPKEPFKIVTVKAGETLDLGEIKAALPPPPDVAGMGEEEFNPWEEGDDQPKAGFQP